MLSNNPSQGEEWAIKQGKGAESRRFLFKRATPSLFCSIAFSLSRLLSAIQNLPSSFLSLLM